jgi:hypothetical protein
MAAKAVLATINLSLMWRSKTSLVHLIMVLTVLRLCRAWLA